MGTSLSGLTPATTFDGLLKVGDNDPLTADLKAISTGDGTDTILQLSNSAFQVNGATFIESDLVDSNIFQIGPSSAANKFRIYNSADINNPNWYIGGTNPDSRISFGSTMILRANGNNIMSLTTSEARIGGGSGARLAIKGSGTTSATTSLLVQNSAGTDLFSIKDDGLFTLSDNGGGDVLTIENGSNISQIRYNDNLWLGSSHGTYAPTLKIDRTAGLSVETNSGSLLNLLYDTGNLGIGETTPTARLHVKGSGNDNTTTSLLVQNSNGDDMMVLDDSKEVSFKGRSGFYNGVFIVENNHTKTQGNAIIGAFATPTARLQVKGSGATSATTALLVQNSAGTDVLKVQDDGISTFAGNNGNGSVPAGFELQPNTSAQPTWGPRIYSYYNNNKWLQIYKGSSFYTFGDNGLCISSASATPTAKLHIKGSGATSATTALLVENSAGTEHLKITDDGVVNVRQALNVNHITNSLRSLRLGWGSIYATDNASELSIGAVYSQTTAPKITLGGKTRAAGADAIQVQALNGMYIATTANTEDPSAQLHIKGSGTTSATNALLVQNSGGADLLKVVDDGTLRLAGNKSVRFFGNESIEGSNQGGNHIRIAESSFWGSTRINAPTNITEGNDAPDASAMLQVDSTTQGFLPPRMTDAERDAITSPAAGLMIYDTANNQMNYWNGSTWIAF